MKKLSRGFTLVEIAIVIAIISVLATMTLVVYNNVQKDSRDIKRDTDIRLLMRALDKYYDDNGEYPAACPTYSTECSISKLADYLVPKYISDIPHDPAYISTDSTTAQKDYLYVDSSNPSIYGIRIVYETRATCKTGVNTPTTWWGTSVPMCASL